MKIKYIFILTVVSIVVLSAIGFWISLCHMLGWNSFLLEASTPFKVTKAFKIPSAAMSPTLQPGDRIITIKYISDPNPQRGDIVVFIFPVDETKMFIKRIIGLPGETLEIKDGRIIIDGTPIHGKFYYYNRGDFGKEGQAIHIPEDGYFVLGDNSSASRDSRYFGFVPKKNIYAKAVRVWWPVRRVGDIE